MSTIEPTELLAAALAIKTEANTAFKGKQFAVAIETYTKALETLTDAQQGAGESKRTGSGALKYNTSKMKVARILDPSFKKDVAVLYANRAAAYLKLTPPSKQHYQQVIEDCTKSLDANSSYTKSMFRKAQAFEGMAQLVRKEGDFGGREMQGALLALSTLLRVEPNNTVARKMMARVQKLMQQAKAERDSPLTYITRMMDGSTRALITDINILMTKFTRSFENQQIIVNAQFPSFLVELLVKATASLPSSSSSSPSSPTPSSPPSVCSDAVLTALVKKADKTALTPLLIRATQMIAASPLYQMNTQTPISSSSSLPPAMLLLKDHHIKHLLDNTEHISTKLLAISASASPSPSSPPPSLSLSSSVEVDVGIIRGLVTLLCQTVARPGLQSRYMMHRQPIVRMLVDCIKNQEAIVVPSVSSGVIGATENNRNGKGSTNNKNSNSENSRSTKNTNHHHANSLRAFMGEQFLSLSLFIWEALVHLSSADEEALTLVRRMCIPALLFSDFTQLAWTRPNVSLPLLAVLAHLTRAKLAGPASSKPTHPSAQTAENKSEEEKGADDTEKELLFQQQVTHIVCARLFAQEEEIVLQGLRGLSLLLQSNSTLGAQITRAIIASPSGKNANSNTGQSAVGAEEGKEAPTAQNNPLLRLIELAQQTASSAASPASGAVTVNKLAAEVLSFASSDSIIRSSLAVAGHAELLFDFFVSANTDMTGNGAEAATPNHRQCLVQCHTGLALSKIAADGTFPLSDEQHDILTQTMMDLLLRFDREVDAKASAKGIGASTSSSALSSSSSLQSYQHHRKLIIRHAVESLAYLTLDFRSKSLLASFQNGACLQIVLKLLGYTPVIPSNGSSSTTTTNTNTSSGRESGEEKDKFNLDPATRFGAVQVVVNLSISMEDLEQEYNTELRELQKLAQRGLPSKNKKKKTIVNDKGEEEEVDVDEDLERMQRAGPQVGIDVIKQLMVRNGVVSGLVHTAKVYAVNHQRSLKHTQSSTGEEKPSGTKAGKASTARSKREREGKSASSSDASKVDAKTGLSHVVANNIAKALLKLADLPVNRGSLVAEGALSLLTKLHAHPSPTCQKLSALAIARTCISTNPNHLPKVELVFELIDPLLSLINKSDHELHIFEATMALTNLSSMNDKLRNRVVQEGGWASMQDLLVSDNVMVQRAGIECLTNLSTCSKATERLSSPSGMHDLTFFLIFAESDDLSSRLAATGALAMITSDEEIAKNLCALSVRTVKSSAMIAQENKEKKDKVADTDADDGDDDKTYARSALDVLVSVMQDPQQDQGVMQRMQVLFANLNQYKLLPGTE